MRRRRRIGAGPLHTLRSAASLRRMRVTFVRHAASEWSGKPILCGHTDIPLSAVGERQCDALATRLAGRTFDALWSSPLVRARTTASAIGDAIGHAVVTDPRLSELYLGTLEGVRFADLPQGPGTFRDRWQRNPGTVRFPKGETMREVASRTWTVLEELYDRHPKGHVLVVSHMFAISAALCRVLQVRVGRFRTFGVDLASLTTIQMDGDGFRLLMLNDTGHLTAEDLGPRGKLPVLPERSF